MSLIEQQGYESRESTENRERQELMNLFDEWSRRFIENTNKAMTQEFTTTSSDYDLNSRQFIQDVAELFGDVETDEISLKAKEMVDRLRQVLQSAEVKKRKKANGEGYKNQKIYKIVPDWLVWEINYNEGVSFSLENAFEIIFKDGGLIDIYVDYQLFTTIERSRFDNPKMELEKIDKVVREKIFDKLDLKTFLALDADTKRTILKYQKDIVERMEDKYIETTVHLIECLQALTEFRGLSVGWDKGDEIKEILHKASQDLKRKLFPHRKKSFSEVDEILANNLLELDKKKADLHRKLVSFRYVTEHGIGRNRVTAEVEIRMRVESKDSIPIRDNIVGVWSSEYKNVWIGEGPSFSIIFGSGERMTFSPDGDLIAAPDPSYSSFVSSGRTRKHDSDLVNKIIKLVAVRYPGLHGFNNLKISGSFHYSFAGNEVVFKKSDISKVSERNGSSPEAIAQGICNIVKKCIEKRVKTRK